MNEIGNDDSGIFTFKVAGQLASIQQVQQIRDEYAQLEEMLARSLTLTIQTNGTWDISGISNDFDDLCRAVPMNRDCSVREQAGAIRQAQAEEPVLHLTNAGETPALHSSLIWDAENAFEAERRNVRNSIPLTDMSAATGESYARALDEIHGSGQHPASNNGAKEIVDAIKGIASLIGPNKLITLFTGM